MTNTLKGPQRVKQTFVSIHSQFPRPLSIRHQAFRAAFVSHRNYATPPTNNNKDDGKDTKSLIQKNIPTALAPNDDPEDLINGPLSTIPPPLNLPARDPKTLAVQHLWNIGRTYGKFYWAGLKATWTNHKAAGVLKKHIVTTNRQKGMSAMPRPLLAHIEFYMNHTAPITRRDFQLLIREQQDFKKVPPFALLVALFGEWLPLVVPFIPGAVPRTCRIPSQIQGMRKAVEERRKASFRQGLSTPDTAPSVTDEKMPALEGGKKAIPKLYRAMQVSNHICNLDKPRVLHVSTTLNVGGGKLFEKLNLVHPALPLRLMKHWAYLRMDDDLLLEDRVMSHLSLSEEETRIACEERGIDVVGRNEGDLKSDLSKWLDGRKRDNGDGQEILNMIFTRPNTWN